MSRREGAAGESGVSGCDMCGCPVGARACPGLDEEVRFLMPIPGSLRGCRGGRTGLGPGHRERAVPPARGRESGASCQPGGRAAPGVSQAEGVTPHVLGDHPAADPRPVRGCPCAGLPKACLHRSRQAVVSPAPSGQPPGLIWAHGNGTTGAFYRTGGWSEWAGQVVMDTDTGDRRAVLSRSF